jgi:hypothetical protein
MGTFELMTGILHTDMQSVCILDVTQCLRTTRSPTECARPRYEAFVRVHAADVQRQLSSSATPVSFQMPTATAVRCCVYVPLAE